MSKVDRKLSKSDEEVMKKIANETDDPQMKRAIEQRLCKRTGDNTVSK